MSSEKEYPTYLNEGIRNEVFTWLLSARYWLGYMTGINGKNLGAMCHELQFMWYSNWGIRVSITPVSDRSFYYNTFRDSALEFQQKTFAYLLPKSEYKSIDLEFLKLTSEVEYLIEHFFPSIQRANTWTVCNAGESDHCIGKLGKISLCYIIGDKVICDDCLLARKEKEEKGFEGFIYLIGNHEQKIYKIGLSRQPKERYKAFSTKLPFKVEVIHQIETTDMRKAEKVLHQWMNDKKAHGEWFNLSQADVDFMCSLATFEKESFIDKSGNAVLEYPT